MTNRIRASTSDAASAYAVIVDCSNWLNAKGIAQWDPVYPRSRFDSEVEAGNVWIWKNGDAIDATVTLLSERPAYYPEGIWQDAAKAWYLCRFAVARRLKGAGLGKRLLVEIERDAQLDELFALRLDVAVANPFLASYYAANGFDEVGRGDIRGGASIFFERLIPGA